MHVYALPRSSEIGGDEGNKIKPQTRQILHCCVVPLIWLLYNDEEKKTMINHLRNLSNAVPKEKPSWRRILDRRIPRREWISRSNPENKRSLSLNTKEVTNENRSSTYYVLRDFEEKKVL